MRYGMITKSMANIYTGVTVKLTDDDDLEYFMLEEDQFCTAIHKSAFVFISKSEFDFFAPRTEFILNFIEYNDQVTADQIESFNQFLLRKIKP